MKGIRPPFSPVPLGTAPIIMGSPTRPSRLPPSPPPGTLLGAQTGDSGDDRSGVSGGSSDQHKGEGTSFGSRARASGSGNEGNGSGIPKKGAKSSPSAAKDIFSRYGWGLVNGFTDLLEYLSSKVVCVCVCVPKFHSEE